MGAREALSGRCHCGALAFDFGPIADPGELQPRACDCGFCTRHGAAWVSDPAGTLHFREERAHALHEYRQGSGTARFLLCRDCGVLVGVVFEEAGRLYGAANAHCIDGAGFGDPVVVSPRRLDAGAKVQRWLGVWVRDVRLSRHADD